MNPAGRRFFLRWARDPNTAARLGLGVSHIGASHIDRIADDFKRVLRQSLLFLRHVRIAEVRRDGALLLGCELDRGDGSDLKVSFRPDGDVEYWHILRTDASEAAERLYDAHPLLAPLDRGTEVGIGLQTDPELLAEGLLYAFLPTEQSSGLPLHINADFFPESNRQGGDLRGASARAGVERDVAGSRGYRNRTRSRRLAANTRARPSCGRSSARPTS